MNQDQTNEIKSKKSFFKPFLVKIDRIFAWILFGSMLVYFLSGYGITKQILDPALSLKLHTQIMPIIILGAFTIHTSFAIHLALIRWRMWNKATASILVLFYLIFLSFFLYTEIFYKPSQSSNTFSTKTNNNQGEEADDEEGGSASQNTNPSNTTTTQKSFTTAELAKFNGQNNQPAYVAVDGIVYDVSKVFGSGVHYSHLAGKELSSAFHSMHAKSFITKYPVVGQLK